MLRIPHLLEMRPLIGLTWFALPPSLLAVKTERACAGVKVEVKEGLVEGALRLKYSMANADALTPYTERLPAWGLKGTQLEKKTAKSQHADLQLVISCCQKGLALITPLHAEFSDLWNAYHKGNAMVADGNFTSVVKNLWGLPDDSLVEWLLRDKDAKGLHKFVVLRTQLPEHFRFGEEHSFRTHGCRAPSSLFGRRAWAPPEGKGVRGR